MVIPSPRPVHLLDAWALTSFAGTGPGARSERHVLLSCSLSYENLKGPARAGRRGLGSWGRDADPAPAAARQTPRQKQQHN